jgi:hypothetical protein
MMMDPNATLDLMRKFATKIHTEYQDIDGDGIDQDDAEYLASLIESLDRWLSRGGFLPKAWEREGK